MAAILKSAQAGLPNTSRIDYLDWLRVLATLSVFLFHNARFFDVYSDWHVRNVTTWIGGTIIVGFLSQWIMPIFFVLAGASTYYSLRSRSGGQFARERALRLLIPFIFGMLVIVAPQAYLDLVSHGRLTGESFWQFYPQFLMSLPQMFASSQWFHLWFLLYLFTFSIACLPLFLPVKSGESLLSRIASLAGSRWVLLLLLVSPLALVDILIYPGGIWGGRWSGGWSMPAYLLFFISGYLVFSNRRTLDAMRRLWWIAPVIAVITTPVLLQLTIVLVDLPGNYGSAAYAVSQAIQALNTWCLLIIILNLGVRFLNFRNGFLNYAAEAVLPFYVLHQTIIIVLGYYICQWDIDPALKYLLITTCSFITIMGIYELLIRRWNIMRFFFGMRRIKKTVRQIP